MTNPTYFEVILYLSIVFGLLFLFLPNSFWKFLIKYINSGDLIKSIIFAHPGRSFMTKIIKEKGLRLVIGIGFILIGILIFYYKK
jgi:hypothetical protein